MIIRAAYLFDEHGGLLRDAFVRLEGGQIAAVGRRRDVDGNVDEDFGDCVILPGLVNAHTHLELGYAAGRCPPSADFLAWLQALMSEIRDAEDRPGVIEKAVIAGLRDALRSGVTLLGDITREPRRTRPVLAGPEIRPAVVSFGEVIAVGRLRGECEERIATAGDATLGGDTLHIGLSPHAPYTVEPRCLRTCAREALARGLPMCIHAAETEAEVRLALRGDGPLRDFLTALRIWDDQVPTAGCRPIELLDQCQCLSPRTLLAHGNYLEDHEIELLAQRQVSVAWCPRTHAAFGHPPHPFRRLRAGGVNVGLGTDSLASNPSLSLLEEIRFVHREHPDVAASDVLTMATSAGARALGQGDVTGRLRPGLRADLAILALDPGATRSPLENIMEGEAGVVACYVAGRRA
jgi:cytosine/adenosine deaminase-related metal-dependent hydrolase